MQTSQFLNVSRAKRIISEPTSLYQIPIDDKAIPFFRFPSYQHHKWHHNKIQNKDKKLTQRVTNKLPTVKNAIRKENQDDYVRGSAKTSCS